MQMDFFAAASSVWKRIRERVEPPEDGVLAIISAIVLPGLPICAGKKSGPYRISPEASSQFSTKTLCKLGTASPCTRNTVSRHLGLRFSENRHQSANPAPPMNAIEPSMIVSSRWVRLFERNQ